jgi:dynein assembly factor 1, axonemal
MEMTKKALLDICKQNDLYRTPSLNDKMYANFQAFIQIANLEEYTGLKALFLEGNALVSLEGLPTLPHLKCMCGAENITHAHMPKLLRVLDQTPPAKFRISFHAHDLLLPH